MIRYQGEDLDFTVELNPKEANDIQSFKNCGYVFVYFYTSTSYIVKFTDSGIAGYKSLNVSADGTVLSGTIPGADTAKMNGALYVDVLIADEERAKHKIQSVLTGIEIKYAPIKQEIQ